MLYIHRVRIRNLKCFSDVDMTLNTDGESLPWCLFVGDNGTGKTALLRSIAMGLCDESSAAGLMKEAAAGYIRRGEKKASVVLDLRRPNGRKNYRIDTIIEKIPSRHGSFERLRQRTNPSPFPWNEIFLSAYGAGRGTGGTGDISGYSSIDAVYNLFNYGEGLQNPELTVRRLTSSTLTKSIRKSLEQLLGTGEICFTRDGVTIDGKWGKGMPLRDLADGYKATFLWVTDFLGWALSYYKDWEGAKAIEGILLIDELEQHLHATWQRSLVHQLKELFPRVQVLTSTHSPLIASSIGELGHPKRGVGDKLFLLHGRPVSVSELPHMRGDRVDQVLASRAFKYLVERDPGIEDMLVRASVLTGMGDDRNKTEEAEYRSLLKKIDSLNLDSSTTVPGRELERSHLDELKELVRRAEELGKSKR